MATASELFTVDETGLVAEATFIASPNCDERPAGVEPVLLIVHGISLPPGEFGGDQIAQLFTNTLDHSGHPYFEQLRGLYVSSHFLIRRDGELVQFVPCAHRAWHAGASRWRERERCNDYSIGVELEGADEVPYTDAQYDTLARLAQSLCARYDLQDFVGHSDVAPGRKTDPGPSFDWPRFRALLAR